MGTDERLVRGKVETSDAKLVLFNAIVAAKSSYVCRLRDNSSYEILESRPRSAADRAADVLSDEIVEIGLHSRATNKNEKTASQRREFRQGRGKKRGRFACFRVKKEHGVVRLLEKLTASSLQASSTVPQAASQQAS